MDKQNFEAKDRFPLSTQALNFMQDMIMASAQLALIGGDNYILSGCTIQGNRVSDGIIVINGEILPFEGGTIVPTITIVETPVSVTANGLTFEKARVLRKARFATGSGKNYYPWADFKLLKTNKQLEEAKATVNYVDSEIAKLQAGNIPAGVIVMWSGSEASIPNGWALCDGREYAPGKFTPNLVGKFIVGFNRNDNDYNVIGKTGGQKNFILSPEQQGALEIKLFWGCQQSYTDNDGYNPLIGQNINGVVFPERKVRHEAWDPNFTKIKLKQAEQSVENRPPYYVLAYIIKL